MWHISVYNDALHLANNFHTCPYNGLVYIENESFDFALNGSFALSLFNPSGQSGTQKQNVMFQYATVHPRTLQHFIRGGCCPLISWYITFQPSGKWY